jgi:hypothetical protein
VATVTQVEIQDELFVRSHGESPQPAQVGCWIFSPADGAGPDYTSPTCTYEEAANLLSEHANGITEWVLLP